jgi:hypothetical protein
MKLRPASPSSRFTFDCKKEFPARHPPDMGVTGPILDKMAKAEHPDGSRLTGQSRYPRRRA